METELGTDKHPLKNINPDERFMLEALRQAKKAMKSIRRIMMQAQTVICSDTKRQMMNTTGDFILRKCHQRTENAVFMI